MPRNKSIDVLKGIAVSGVVLYHLNILRFGYLGVDIFFVISGYLTTTSLIKHFDNYEFNYFPFIIERIKRLMPLILIVSGICLCIGAIGMLPDDFENLSESIVASNIFSENILAAITTGNYWDISNAYKPLMHMWYIGVLFEFYLFYPLILYALNQINIKKTNRSIVYGIMFFGAVSLVLYLCPGFSNAQKFYFLPFRMFEFCVGGLAVFYLLKSANLEKISIIRRVSVICILGLLIINYSLGFEKVRLIITVLATGLFIISKNRTEEDGLIKTILSSFGQKSYSIFVWHQVMLAFYRYFISNKFDFLFLVLFLFCLFVLSELSYKYIEKGIEKLSSVQIVKVCSIGFFVVMLGALFIYTKAGVIRNIPELNVYVSNVHRGMHGEYNDRVYQMDREFTKTKDIKILVCGVSFARDWVNVLLESSIAEKLDVTYSYSYDKSLIQRIKEADYIFIYDYKNNVPDYFFDNIDEKNIYGIGTKNFGENNGIIYKHRFESDYFEQSIILNDFYENDNIKRREEWKDNYIDMIEAIRNSDHSIPIFTDDKMFISQDTTHLTQAGARYYAKLFNEFITSLDYTASREDLQ